MVRHIVFRLAILGSCLCGCATGLDGTQPDDSAGKAKVHPSVEARLGRRIADHEARIAPLSAQLNETYWAAMTDGAAKAYGRVTELEQLIRDQYADPQAYAALQGLQASGKVEAPRLRRQLEMLLALYRENQTPAGLREDLVRRALALEEVHARIPWQADAEVIGVLMSEPDGEIRKAAWEKAMQRGAKVRDGLLELVKLRNRAARALGYADYYQMRLRLEGLDPAWLETLADRVARETRAPFAATADRIRRRLAQRFGIAAEDVRPWHYEDLYFQRVPVSVGVDLDPLFEAHSPEVLARTSFQRLGWSPADVLAHSDLQLREGKPATAFCLDVDRSGDVRILASLQPGLRSSAILLHELGHAFFFSHLPSSLPWLLRQPASEALGEAVALLFADLTRDEEWLTEVLGVPARRLDIRRADLRQQRRDELLVYVRFCLLMIHFERELYRDPDQDLVELWWRLRARYQLMA
ncbi:MAG: M3 family metallopeptidase, partial [Anaerolineae bacterium]